MGNICVIGPRASGKTTYLAALAYKKLRASKSRKLSFIPENFSISPGNDDARELAGKAANIICQGDALRPTVIGEELRSVDDLPNYLFNINSRKFPFSKPDKFQLNVRDYPGEIFEQIVDSGESDPVVEEFINECLNKNIVGCLILLTSWEEGADDFYHRVMNRFIDLMDIHDRSNDFRLAIAMSKCERGELWSGRLDPETDLFRVHLPKTTDTLRDPDRVDQRNLRFYAISTFGVLERNDPRPNRTDEKGKEGKASILRNTKSWQPYNLIEPLTWLSQTKQTKITKS